MVAAGVQTNGITVGVRRLTKSFSEVGGDRLAGRDTTSEMNATVERYKSTNTKMFVCAIEPGPNVDLKKNISFSVLLPMIMRNYIGHSQKNRPDHLDHQRQ